MIKHLAVFPQDALDDIFSCKKKIEGRFSQIKIPPFGKVSAGDVVLMKLSGEKIVGQFVVDRVIYFDHPREEEFQTLFKKYARELKIPQTFWLSHERVNYISLMFIKSVTKFLIAPVIPKRDLRPWVVLG